MAKVVLVSVLTEIAVWADAVVAAADVLLALAASALLVLAVVAEDAGADVELEEADVLLVLELAQAVRMAEAAVIADKRRN